MLISLNTSEEHTKAQRTLADAKEANKDKICSVVVDERTTIYITAAQFADGKFMKRFWKRWKRTSL